MNLNATLFAQIAVFGILWWFTMKFVWRVSNGVRQLPSLGVKIAEQVEQKGIVALAYDDPEIQRAGRAVGEEIGLGMRSFAIAVAKDMIMTARENR